MATVATVPDWSSLPADLVNRVADRFLATNDLDCYMDFRAVCHHWRSITADPKNNPADPLFRPSRWVMLDEAASDSDAHLFVNTTTGRFLRKGLPLLRDHVFIITTTGGFVVLADRRPPHAVRVLNPFTGSVIWFLAPMPPAEPRLTADVVGSSPTLVLVSTSSRMVYWADPQSESFCAKRASISRPACRLPLIAAGKHASGGTEPVADAADSEADWSFGRVGSGEWCRYYAVEVAAGEMLGVVKESSGVQVFRIDSAGNVIERVRSIGNRALFLGIRCLAVHADAFPTIDANCVYFQLTDTGATALPVVEQDIYKYDLETLREEEEEEPEHVSAAIDTGTVWRCNMGPFTMLQLLSNYTMDIPGHMLSWEKNSIGNSRYNAAISDEEDGFYREYADYVDYGSEDYSESEYEPDDWGFFYTKDY